MNDIKNLVLEVLEDGFIMNLGTNDANGSWVASLVYVFDDQLNLYWVSVPTSQHSQAIDKNPQVACTILADYTTDKERALQIAGTAIALPEASLEREQALQKKRSMAIPTKAGEMLTNGYQWYKLTPTRIELIHNELFGYERKRLL